ncbi:MAG: hypothetical protein KAS85_02490, partial [Rhodobacteraceae bacterium]|nr:hypothetical protein [Paracoccaceae bacterium]
MEVQAPINGNFDEFPNFAYSPIQDHTTNTPNYNDPDKYAYVTIDIGDRNPDDVWLLLTDIHEQFLISSPNYSYNLGQNSNSYAATLLWMVGVDIDDYLSAVTPTDVTAEDPFPGANRNVLTDGYGFGGSINFDLTLEGTNGDDILRTGTGNDWLTGGLGDDTIYAGGNNDELYGGTGDDLLYGEDGDDTLIGGTGSDLLDGGDGLDVVDYLLVSDPETAVRDIGIYLYASGASDSIDVVDGLGGTDTLVSIETIVGTSFGDVFSFSGDLVSAIEGLLLIDGGANNASGDLLDFSGITGGLGVQVTLAQFDFGLVNVVGGTDAGSLKIDEIESVIGTAFNDKIIGNDQNNWIDGGDGDDVITAGAGDDFVIGGLGNDTLDGGNHNQNGDVLDYSSVSDSLRFRLSVPLGVGQPAVFQVNQYEISNGWVDTAQNFENYILTAQTDLAFLEGSIENFGGLSIDAGTNATVISVDPIAWAGQPIYSIEMDGDVLSMELLASPTGAVLTDTDEIHVQLDNIDTAEVDDDGTLVSGATTINLIGFENVLGSNASDTIHGNESENSLFGFGGNDTLVGRGGGEYLVGGAGDDILAGGYWDGVEFWNDPDFELGDDNVPYQDDGVRDVLIGGAGIDIFLASNNDLIVDKSFGDLFAYTNYGTNDEGKVYFNGLELT